MDHRAGQSRTAVTKANYYDPEINPAYRDLAVHYGVAVIPARVRSPQDKGIVEGSVGWLEIWLLEWLRGQQFMSFPELNGAIGKRLAELVRRPFQKRAGSRESVFRELDQPALRPCRRNLMSMRFTRNGMYPITITSNTPGFITRCRTNTTSRK
ncbi:hypothetical protein FACS1894137_18650 [Spirochaetia bacterium]|nr:hypothetical protein FACS1894137_18650 [Spirochaetia bacterium]